MADLSTMWGGLLDAHDNFIAPRAPAGAGYSDDTARMARAALLGQLGGTLLAASQGGQSFDQRARILAGLGNAPTSAAEILQRGTPAPVTDEDRARTGLLRQQTAELQRKADEARKAREWLLSRDAPGGATSAIPGATVPPGPAGPAMPGAVTTTPLPPLPGTGGGGGAPGAPSSPGAPGATPAPAPTPTPPAPAPQGPYRLPRETVQAMIASGMSPEDIVRIEAEEALKRSRPQPGLDPAQTLNAEGELRKEFTGNEAVKGFNEAQRQYTQMNAIVKAANTGQPGAGVNDTALVYAFFKTIDPTSTVREGEFATVGANMGLPAQVVAALQKIDGRGFLTPETRKELAKVAEGYLFRRYEDVERLGGNYRTIAEGRGLKGDNVVVDPRSQETRGRYVTSRLDPGMIAGAGNEELKALRELVPYMQPEQLMALKQRLQMARPARAGGPI